MKKKLLFLLMTLLAIIGSQSARAALYLRGDMNGWAAVDNYKFTQNGSVYTLTLPADIAANKQWKIADENWGNEFYDSSKTTVRYNNGTNIYNFVSGVDKNLKSSVELPAGTKFTYTSGTLEIVLPGDDPNATNPDDPENKYYIYFDNTNNWSSVSVWAWNDSENCTASGVWPGDAMTEKDGLLYWEAPAGKVPSQIIISTNNGNTKAGKDGNTDLDFVNGAIYYPDGTHSMPVDDYPELYLRGEINGWGATDEYKLTREENVYTLTLTKSINADGSWKIADSDWTDGGFTNGDNTTVKYEVGTTNFFSWAGSNMSSLIELPVGTTFTLTYDKTGLNKSTLLVVIPGTEPVPTITKVEIYNENNTDTREFTLNDDGTWTLAGFTPKAWADNSKLEAKYRVRVTTDMDGTISTTDYTTVSGGNEHYWLNNTTPYTMVNAEGGWFLIVKDGDKTNVDLTLTFNGYVLSTMQVQWNENNVSVLEDVNMPLKASAFKNGRAHYFLVGFRTAAWRLQPEWELAKDENGKFTLNNQRLMYSQYFGIAKVNSYDDYIHQRYTIYWADKVLKDAEGTVTLSNHRSTQAYESDGYNDFTADKTLTWLVGRQETELNEKAISEYTPVLLQNFEVTVDADGNPTQLYYKANTSAKEVNKHRTFSLVGSQIKPNDEITIGGITAPITHFTHSYDKNGGVEAWANSWIQYDDNGNPYVDATGHVLFQTAFDKDWLPNHPSNFDITISEEGNEPTIFTYDSSVITFQNVASFSDDERSTDPYSPLYEMHPEDEQFDFENTDMVDGERSIDLPGTNFQYKEKFSYPEGNESDLKSTENLSYNQSGWHCFVVKDAWMSGSFKIWSGWGGNLKYGEGGDDVDGMRWFVDNGGHGDKCDKAVEGGPVTNGSISTLYGTRMDVFDSNFHVVDNTYEEGVTDLAEHNPLVYYKRVILWYNEGKYGMNSAVLQLITEPLAPSVLATRRGKNDIGYRWNIPAVEGIDANEKVIKVAIERHTLNGNTVVAAKSVPSYYTTNEAEFKTANDLTKWNGYFYETGVAPGTYEYEISVWYEGEDVEAPSIHTATSNTVKIYAAAQPVNLKAAQRKEVKDGKTLYSFDMVLTPTINENVINRTVEGKSGLSMAKEIVITPADDYTRDALAAARTVEFGGWKYADGQFTISIADLDQEELSLDIITIRDIAPNAGLNTLIHGEDQEYAFTAKLTPKDDIDANIWARINYAASNASGSIEAPTVKVTLHQPMLVAVNTTEDRDDIANSLALAGDAHKYLPAGSHLNGRLENPAVYTLFNEVMADASVSSLAVTQSVKDHWDVTNRFSVNSGTVVTLEPNQYPTAVTFHGIPVKYKSQVDISEIEEDMRYVLDDNDVVALAKTSVSYSRSGVEGAPAYITPASPGSTQKFKLNLGNPTFRMDEKTWFQLNYAEPNNASPLNNRAIATAQFDGYVEGLVEGLNYYVGYHFTVDGMDDMLANLASLKSGVNSGVSVYQSIIDGKAAQGGRIIGRRGSVEGSTNGKSLVKELDFEYLYSRDFVDDEAYIKSWNVNTNSWTHASKKDNNRIPFEICPIAVGATDADLSEEVAKVDIKGSVSVVYPIYDVLSVTNSSAAPLAVSGMHKAPQEAEADHEVSINDYDHVVGLSVDSNAGAKLPVTLSADDKLTGIDTIAADSVNADSEIYSLQGIRVATPTPGNYYIIRRGTEATKVLCK